MVRPQASESPSLLSSVEEGDHDDDDDDDKEDEMLSDRQSSTYAFAGVAATQA